MKIGKTGKVYGVDVLRYWVAAHGCQTNFIHVGDNLMDLTKQEVDRIRNAMRFLLGMAVQFHIFYA